MLKFFRKYRNWILAVGGSVLMVAFLLGSIIGQLGQLAPSPTVATITVDGKIRKIRLIDRQYAGMEVEMFKQSIEAQIDLLGEYDDGDPDTKQLENALHWYLLKLQAEQAGLQGGVGDAQNSLMMDAASLAAYDPSVNGNIDLAYQQVLLNLRRSAGRLNERETLLAVADYLAVQRLIRIYHGSSIPSDYRIQTFANKFLDGANVATVFVDASDFIDDEPEPSLEAQQALFAKNADVLPGEGEFGLGYRLPDRVQFEYITIDFQSILADIKVSPLDANLWFKRQNTENMQPAPGQTGPPTFENSRDQAILAYKTELAEAKMNEIIDAVKAKLLRSSRQLERAGAYRILPENWASERLYFTKLQEEIQAEFGVTVSYRALGKDWVLVDLPVDTGEIALAQRAAGSQFIGLGPVLKSYRAFGNPEIPGLQSGVADIEPFRARSFFPILGRDRRAPSWTDAIFMRVTAIDPARPAQTLDEVKDEVIRDLKRIAVYERLKTEQDEYLARAIKDGVRKIAEDLGVRTNAGSIVNLDSRALATTAGFVPSSVSALGEDKDFSLAVIAKAKTINETGDIKGLPRSERTIVAPFPSKLGIVIAVIERKTPMTRKRLQSHLIRQFTYLQPSETTVRYRFGDVYAAYELDRKIPGINPFSFEALSNRFNFKWENDYAPVPDEDEDANGFGTGNTGTDANTTDDSK